MRLTIIFLSSYLCVSMMDFVHPAPVSACGLVGGPTMLANGHPAIPNPARPTVSGVWAPGLFTDEFIANRPIKFTEDIPAVALPPGQGPLQLRWNFGDGTLPTSTERPHLFHQPGHYQVWSQFFDPITKRWLTLDGSALDVLAAPFANPPVVHAQADKNTIQIGGTVSFNSAGSFVRAGNIRSVEWNFGDGAGSHELQPKHRFTQVGNSKVVLIITDSRGARATDSLTVIITTPLPVARLAFSGAHARVGQVLTFDGHQSEPSGPAEQVTAYQWNFGDGTLPVQQRAAQITHSYTHSGTYLVTLKVADSTGAVNQVQATVTISAAPPPQSLLPWFLVGLGGLLLSLVFILIQGKYLSKKTGK